MILKLLLAGAGGFTGSICRYLTGLACAKLFSNAQFPFGTFAANILGCLLIGIVGGIWESEKWISEEMRVLLMVGFLGGFTTFSAFGWESLTLIRNGFPGMAILNVGLQLSFGLLAVWLGLCLSRML